MTVRLGTSLNYILPHTEPRNVCSKRHVLELFLLQCLTCILRVHVNQHPTNRMNSLSKHKSHQNLVMHNLNNAQSHTIWKLNIWLKTFPPFQEEWTSKLWRPTNTAHCALALFQAQFSK